MYASALAGALALVAATAGAQQSPSATPASAMPVSAISASGSSALSSPADSAATLVVTRAEAVALALGHNPELEIARQQTLQAEARVSEATALPEPAFASQLEQERGFLQPHSATTKDIGLAVTIPFPDKIRLQGQVARSDVGAAALAYTQSRQLIAAETAQGYDSLLVALRHRSDLRESLLLAQQFLARTKARFNGGTVPRIDVVKAEVAVAEAQNGLLANARDVVDARAGLNRLLGRVLGAPVAPADSLTVPAAPPELSLLEAQARAARPELRSLAVQRRGASAARTLASEFWLPDVSVTLSRNFTTGSPSAYSTGIGIGLPLFFWQHKNGEVAEAQHRELELAAAERDVAAQIGQEVRGAYASATTARQQTIYLRDQLLPEARQAYHIAFVSYGLGGSSALDVLDARRTLLEAEAQFADALGAANDAAAQLQLAVGAPLDATFPGDTTHAR